jgi:hypothetical protein
LKGAWPRIGTWAKERVGGKNFSEREGSDLQGKVSEARPLSIGPGTPSGGWRPISIVE